MSVASQPEPSAVVAKFLKRPPRLFIGVAGTRDYFRYMAGWATRIEGSTFATSIHGPPGVKFHTYTQREPVGVVAQIVPWNFPLAMAAWKLGPVLATGCTSILKPAEQTPLTTLRLAELIAEAGFPPGVVNVLTVERSVADSVFFSCFAIELRKIWSS